LIANYKKANESTEQKPIEDTPSLIPTENKNKENLPSTEANKEKPNEEKPSEEKKQEVPLTTFKPTVTSVKDKSLRTGAESHHKVFAKVLFLNEHSFPINLYQGVPDGNGDIVSTMRIAPGELAETNELFVTYEDYTDLNELNKVYTFYFYGTENGKNVFGKVPLSMKPYMVYTFNLNPQSILMTPTGDKDQNALRRQGIRFE
jgi:hypothetical protein